MQHTRLLDMLAMVEQNRFIQVRPRNALLSQTLILMGLVLKDLSMKLTSDTTATLRRHPGKVRAETGSDDPCS